MRLKVNAGFPKTGTSMIQLSLFTYLIDLDKVNVITGDRNYANQKGYVYIEGLWDFILRDIPMPLTSYDIIQSLSMESTKVFYLSNENILQQNSRFTWTNIDIQFEENFNRLEGIFSSWEITYLIGLRAQNSWAPSYYSEVYNKIVPLKPQYIFKSIWLKEKVFIEHSYFDIRYLEPIIKKRKTILYLVEDVENMHQQIRVWCEIDIPEFVLSKQSNVKYLGGNKRRTNRISVVSFFRPIIPVHVKNANPLNVRKIFQKLEIIKIPKVKIRDFSKRHKHLICLFFTARNTWLLKYFTHEKLLRYGYYK